MQPTRQGLVNLHMLAQLAWTFPHQPTHPRPEAAPPPLPRGVRRGAVRGGGRPCDSRDVWSPRPLRGHSGPTIGFTRRRRWCGGMQIDAGVSVKDTLHRITCSQRRSLADVGCTFFEGSKSKCMMRRAHRLRFPVPLSRWSLFPSYHKHPRPCVLSLLDYSSVPF